MEVTLIDYMGDDLRVVNAARVSFHKESDWQFMGRGWDRNDSSQLHLTQPDQKLIKYLATHNHFTPFTHVMITMREKVPIFVARQRYKHSVGFSYNEVSRRYVDDKPEFFVPDVWRKRPDGSVKQGSSDEEVTEIIHPHTNQKWDIKKAYEDCMRELQLYYETLISSGVAPEQARMVLPQSLYTEYYCTGSLAAWARAYKLRSDPHAQKEIQDLARMWNDVISGIKELEHSWKTLTQ